MSSKRVVDKGVTRRIRVVHRGDVRWGITLRIQWACHPEERYLRDEGPMDLSTARKCMGPSLGVVRKRTTPPPQDDKGEGLPATHEVDDLQLIAVVKSRLGPLIAGSDLTIEFHRHPVGFHAQLLDQCSQGERGGKIAGFAIDVEFRQGVSLPIRLPLSAAGIFAWRRGPSSWPAPGWTNRAGRIRRRQSATRHSPPRR